MNEWQYKGYTITKVKWYYEVTDPYGEFVSTEDTYLEAKATIDTEIQSEKEYKK